MWAWIGAALALAGMALAVRNARTRTPNEVAADFYGMTPRSHARFAWVSAAFTLALIVIAVTRAIPPLPIFAIYVLLFVFYAASFARGFSNG